MLDRGVSQLICLLLEDRRRRGLFFSRRVIRGGLGCMGFRLEPLFELGDLEQQRFRRFALLRYEQKNIVGHCGFRLSFPVENGRGGRNFGNFRFVVFLGWALSPARLLQVALPQVRLPQVLQIRLPQVQLRAPPVPPTGSVTRISGIRYHGIGIPGLQVVEDPSKTRSLGSGIAGGPRRFRVRKVVAQPVKTKAGRK